MSHAIRNSILLFIVLVIFAGLSWGYIEYYQIPEKKEIRKKVEDRHRVLKANQEIADQLPMLTGTFEEASDYFNNYDKALYSSSNEDKVYDFINSLNRGLSFINFNFAFTDSTKQPKYGVMNMEISGEGKYRNLVNFVRGVELSKPLNKIKNVSITPILQENAYDTVSFSFNLESYYDRSKILEKPTFDKSGGVYASVHNPLFALIRDVRPNKDGKIDISQSHLAALGVKRAFLIDQNGVLRQLKIGDEVYLGSLRSINLKERTATFSINEGGIVKQETIKVNSDN
jgi:Tfp pilus assembly protein PilO